MLYITIPASEFWNDTSQEFVTTKQQTLALEHSLVSVSKWESKWHKPFLGKKPKTNDEIFDYIRCMTVTPNQIDPSIYYALTEENIKSIDAYIDDSMSATWFSDDKAKTHGGEEITSELIYYWMIAMNIPFECQKWHLNRLLTLIKICSIKNQPQKKMSNREILSRNAALNAARRAKLGTTG